MSRSSGTSPHLGDAKTTLAIASFRSMGIFLHKKLREQIKYKALKQWGIILSYMLTEIGTNNLS